ncbi:hypothetical protein G3A_02750 [Bacillus sp. 17376]|nr:hypothetical protein G3A_02750 [Bacillus sp. 17376]
MRKIEVQDYLIVNAKADFTVERKRPNVTRQRWINKCS